MHVCDIFGALISNRDYRTAFDVETALDVMLDDVKNFDMRVFLAFQRVAFSGLLEDVVNKGNLKNIEEEEA
jgi:HD-GYP domain-containing protein (c-di-GMP phosphodiesterase class II)